MQSLLSYLTVSAPLLNMNDVHVDVIHPVGKPADRWKGPQ